MPPTDKTSDPYSYSNTNLETSNILLSEANSIFGQLQKSEATFGQSGLTAAAPQYQQAMQMADQINKPAVEQQIAQITEQVSVGGSSDPTLSQELGLLMIADRASGITRANYGLLLISQGQEDLGNQLLLQAEGLDPAMVSDQNFQRHLQTALEESKTKTLQTTVNNDVSNATSGLNSPA